MKKNDVLLLLMGALILLAAATGVILLSNLHTPVKSDRNLLEEMVATNMLLTESALRDLPSPTPEPEVLPLVTSTVQAAVQETDPVAYVDSIIDPATYRTWISQLSGAEPVMIDGQESLIETRYSYAMFTGQENAKAQEYLLQTIRQYVPEEQITIEPYSYVDGMGANTWYNIIVTFPGQSNPNEQVLFTAHFDSCVVFEGDPMKYAPGANDNGTGVATLLEALRAFSSMKFGKTLKLVFFSGEENFQQGSQAYAEQHADDPITAVINMDMYGTDKDGDRCFELYVGQLPGSQELANQVLATIDRYQLNLKADYLVDNAYDKADQKSFWNKNISAVTLMENFLPDYSPGGCEGVTDRTDFWHLPGDTIETVNLEYAYDIGRTGIYTILELADAQPVITLQ